MNYKYKGYEVGIERKPKTYIYKESVISDGNKAPEGYRYFKFLIRKNNTNIAYDIILLKSISKVRQYCNNFIEIL